MLGVKFNDVGNTVTMLLLFEVAVIVMSVLGTLFRLIAKFIEVDSVRLISAVVELTITNGIAISVTGGEELLCGAQFCMKKISIEMVKVTKNMIEIFFLFILSV
mgnify:CR=1 FL=1